MRRNRRSHSIIALAAMTALYGVGAFHHNDGGTGGGGGSPPPPPPPPSDPPAKKKVELTEDDFNARLEAARKEERDKLAADQEKKRKEAEAEEARKKGEFELLANQEREKREAAEAKLARLEHEKAIGDALVKAAKDHPAYPLDVFNEYVAPKLLLNLKPGTAAAEVEKASKDAVKAYVDANPRAAGGGTPNVPGANQRQQRGGGGGAKPNGHRPAIGTAGSRF